MPFSLEEVGRNYYAMLIRFACLVMLQRSDLLDMNKAKALVYLLEKDNRQLYVNKEKTDRNKDTLLIHM